MFTVLWDEVGSASAECWGLARRLIGCDENKHHPRLKAGRCQGNAVGGLAGLVGCPRLFQGSICL